MKLKRTLLLAVVVPLTALGVEGGARAYYAATTGDTGYLRYPAGGPSTLQRTALSSRDDNVGNEDRSLGRVGGLPPGEHEVWAGERFLHSIPINQSGFRGRDLGEADPGTAEIVVAGGSSVFSGDCPPGSAWPELLEARMETRHGAGSLAVVNRGMNGWSTREAVDHVIDEVLTAGAPPAAVILYSAFNALEDAGVFIDLRVGAAPWHTRLLYGRSLYYSVSLHAWMVRQQRAAGLRPDGSRDPEVVAKSYREEVERFVDATRAVGSEPVLVHQAFARASAQRTELMADRFDDHSLRAWPQMVQAFTAKEGPHARLQEVLAEVAEARGVTLIDPREALLEEPERNFVFALHLTEAGAEVLAEEVDLGLADLTRGLGATSAR